MLFGLLFLCALASARLRVTLESNVYQLDAQTESFPVNITLTNEYRFPVTLLKWDSPLDYATDVLRGDMFEARHSSGERAVYTGIVMKRNPVLSDFTTLNVDQSTTVVLDLLKGYYFQSVGEYKIQLATVIQMQDGGLEEDSILANYAAFTAIYVDSDPIYVNVVSAKPAPVWPAPLSANLTGPTPVGCTSTETTQVNKAGSNAITAAKQGYDYLPSTACPSGKPSYTTWFGACTTSRYNKVRTSLNAIYNGLNGAYRANCGGSSCSANTYAYVYPSDTAKNIYLCAVFWRVTSNNCVMDSQPGTLIHEMGHFSNVAGLNDVKYGITPCQDLAKTNPDQAVTNADNYCFYTDSCPR